MTKTMTKTKTKTKTRNPRLLGTCSYSIHHGMERQRQRQTWGYLSSCLLFSPFVVYQSLYRLTYSVIKPWSKKTREDKETDRQQRGRTRDDTKEKGQQRCYAECLRCWRWGARFAFSLTTVSSLTAQRRAEEKQSCAPRRMQTTEACVASRHGEVDANITSQMLFPTNCLSLYDVLWLANVQAMLCSWQMHLSAAQHRLHICKPQDIVKRQHQGDKPTWVLTPPPAVHNQPWQRDSNRRFLGQHEDSVRFLCAFLKSLSSGHWL